MQYSTPKNINFLFAFVFVVVVVVGSFNGTLSKLKASDLGSVVIKEVMKRANVEAPHVNEVIMGQVR